MKESTPYSRSMKRAHKVTGVVIIMTLCFSVVNCGWFPRLISRSPTPTTKNTKPSTLTVSPQTTSSNTYAKKATYTPLPSRTATRTIRPTYAWTPTSTGSSTTWLEPYDAHQALEPGTYLVYWYKNVWYAQSIDGARRIRFLPIETSHSTLALSPDGKRVAFIDANDQAAIYEMETGKVTTYPNPYVGLFWGGPYWSPDGKMLYYSAFFDTVPFDDARSGIYIVWLETGKTKLVIGWGGTFEFGASAPDWSPDGYWIVFTAHVHGKTRYVDNKGYLMEASCIMDPTTCISKSRLIWNDWLWGWYENGLLAVDCTVGDQPGPCVLDINSPDPPKPLADISGLLNSDTFYMWSTFSHDKKYLALDLNHVVDQDKYKGDIYIFNIQDGKAVNITNTPNEDEHLEDWSPDDKFILFSRYYGLEPDPIHEGSSYPCGDLFLIPSTGGEARALTNTPTEREVFAFWLEIK